MKLNFKDLKQQKFSIDAEPSDTIAQVKEKIAAEKGWEATQQKLIYSGKILADANTVESYKIEEKGFIVCMVSRPKTTAASSSKAAPPATPQVASTTPAQPAAPQASTAATVTEPPATPTPAQTNQTTDTTAPAANWNDPSQLLVGQRSEQAVGEMEAMGFARADIDRAMRAAFFNPDRAIEYLLNGIPANLQQEQRPASGTPRAAATAATGQTTGQTAVNPAPAAEAAEGEPVNLFEQAAAQTGQGGGRSGGGGGARGAAAGLGAGAGTGGTLNMDFLRNSPHFQHLRHLVQQQPAMLEPILQQVAEGNPQLAQMIGQNQEQFLQLLSEDIGGDGIGGMGETGPMPPGAVPVSVTEEERDAIERLCRLGFPRDAVVQAYFACDKNEELAANFLFEQPDDDEGQ